MSSSPEPLPPAAPAQAAVSTFRPGKPSSFSGRRKGHGEVLAFIQSCELHFGLTDTTDESKMVMGAITFFEDESNASNWAYPFLRQRPRHPMMSSWQLFTDALILQFGDPNDKQTGWIKLLSLRQTTSVRDFATQFHMTLQRLGLAEDLAMIHFRISLKPEIRNALLGKVFDNLNDLSNTAIQADEERNGYSLRPVSSQTPARPLQPSPAAHSGSLPAPAPQRAPSATPSIAGPRGPLTAEEKQRRRDLRLCLYCGGEGHYTPTCPYKASRSPAPSVGPSESASQVGSTSFLTAQSPREHD